MGAYSTVPFQTKTFTWGSKGSCGNRERNNRDLGKKEVWRRKRIGSDWREGAEGREKTGRDGGTQ